MLIFHYRFGMVDESFTDNDEAQVSRMCRHLDDPANDIDEYETETGHVSYWEKNGKIHGNIFGHNESDIPRASIANAE